MTRICIAHGGDMGVPSGGTDRVTAIAAGLADRGHDVTLVVPTPSDGLPDQLDGVSSVTVDLPLTGVTSQPRRAGRLTRRAIDETRRRDARLQFEHSTLAGIGTLWGASDFVLDMHDLATGSPLYGSLPLGGVVQHVVGAIERRAIERAETVVVVSRKMRDWIVDRWDVSAESVRVVSNGYFEDRVTQHVDRTELPGRVAFLGTLHPKVDVDALVETAILSSVEELVVIGDGPKRSELERASERVDSLTFRGRLPDEQAFAEVASAAVAVNPQHASELQATSTPVKLCYYAALSVPAVVTEGPDLARHLVEEGAAVSVPPNGNFRSPVQRLLGDDDRRQEMEEQARALAADLEWSRRVEQFAPVYEG